MSFFKRRLQTNIQIKSSPEKVWQVLIDFQRYSQWNPFLPEVSGDLFLGAKLKILIRTQNKDQSYAVRLTEVRSPYTLSWLGHFGFIGLIDGDHQFSLQENTDGTTLFVHQEFFQGILVPLVWSFYLNRHLKQGFEDMNRALKQECEKESN